MPTNNRSAPPSPAVLALQVYIDGMVGLAKRMKKSTTNEDINATIKTTVSQAIKVAVDQQREADAQLLDVVAERCIDLNQRVALVKMAKVFRGEMAIEDILSNPDPSALVLPRG